MIEYAIYKGDTFLFIDTLENCAKRLDTSTDYIKWLTYPTALKRFNASKGNRLIAVKLEAEKKPTSAATEISK